ncbi:hypothetical protein F3Y22_tig00001120pilonHSYRG00426 [Hibiscus syriacus]|uniref:Uncharacterized protein n=1 Tax=Hibiscus syriacus TaxID=106335 RepID=A0A6A3D365_HIBSY|nr:hypothetical protein F3Y22_tig00001120pilonHSYRG00426 [Hibiscus syriacus]
MVSDPVDATGSLKSAQFVPVDLFHFLLLRQSRGQWEMHTDEEAVSNHYFVMINLSLRNELKNQLGSFLTLKLRQLAATLCKYHGIKFSVLGEIHYDFTLANRTVKR